MNDTIDVEHFCQVCGKSWSYQDLNMVQVEHVGNIFDAHKHSETELDQYYSTGASIHMMDDED